MEVKFGLFWWSILQVSRRLHLRFDLKHMFIGVQSVFISSGIGSMRIN